MDIVRLLSPIALSSMLTKKVQDYFTSIGQPQLAEAIVSVFVKNSSITVKVSHTLARTEIRMYGETIVQLVTDTLRASVTYSLRIIV